jgi:hypothetical protein
MNQKDKVRTMPEQTSDKFANANDQSAEMLNEKRIQENTAEQRLIAALDVELKQLYSLTMFH